MLHVSGSQTPVEDSLPPEPPRGGGFMKLLVVGVLVVAGVVGVRYYTGGAARLAAADRASGVKPRLVMFTADWCGPCQNFKGTVLADDRVVAAVVDTARFEMVDLTKWEGKPADVASHYGVRAIPTLILVNSQGDEFARYKGPHDPAAFVAWLSKHK